MEQNMSAVSLMVRGTDKVFLHGEVEIDMMETFKIMHSMEMVLIIMLVGQDMLAIGSMGNMMDKLFRQ
jgi:hypothetical protein